MSLIHQIEVAALLKKCGSDLPSFDVRPERKVVEVEEEEIITSPKVFPNDGGRIM
jgi:hypothetical protein